MPEILWGLRIIGPDHWYKVDSSCMVGGDPLNPTTRHYILCRDNFTCVYCGKTEPIMHVDHVFPKSRGGTDELSNLVCACGHCNTSKRDKTPEEWVIRW